jgi:cytoskeletal protein RodZ
MRSWLAEGRVGADTLVWREGWREWQEASATFPQLKPDEATEFFSGLASGSSPAAIPATGAFTVTSLPSKSHSNASSAVIIVVLVVAVIVLLAVLVMALFKSTNEKEESTPPKAKAAVLFLDPQITHAA